MTQDDAMDDPVMESPALDSPAMDDDPRAGDTSNGDTSDLDISNGDTLDRDVDLDVALPPDAWAIVWREGQGFELFVPNVADDDEVPPPALALMGAVLRLQTDAVFAQELAEFMVRDEPSDTRRKIQ